MDDARMVLETQQDHVSIVISAITAVETVSMTYGEAYHCQNLKRGPSASENVVLLSVLTACRYRGAVDAGKEIFDSMVAEYHVELGPEHYGCVIGMLGRAGRLEEAEELMLQMASGPSISALQSLLGACQIHGNTSIAERVANTLTKTEPA
ncbi:hypothetical protein QYE76_038897 [Lolium multiflorum]|uniref:Pentatricopeptide repeat-containing protein n=1 Tax=Lolium multiflorum TaxID=4521 RepID=A0AAD8WRN9_LOLMU|nr:hypothetical protein QYE76_038897 [Lolium multiflorum]